MTGSRIPELKGLAKIVVLGMGRSGVAAAEASARLFPETEVVVSDIQAGLLDEQAERRLSGSGIRVKQGDQDVALLDGCDLVIKSPGIPPETAFLARAAQLGIPVMAEVEFARRFLPNPLIGITGTNGKTTTTKLVSHLLTSAGWPCREAGNIGVALSSLIGISPEEILVTELSSFQLRDCQDFRAEIAVLLNISEDHLDRHADMVEYVLAKTKLLTNRRPGDLALINADDPECRRAVEGLSDLLWFSRKGPLGPGTISFYEAGEIRVDRAAASLAAGKLRESLPASLRSRIVEAHAEDSNGRAKVVSWAEVPLQGEHNLENALAAAGVCSCLGLAPDEIAAGLKSFAGVRHRMQEVATISGVLYVNDSKATNVDATIKALTAYKKGIHLILGGSLKGCSFDALAAAAEKKIREVLLIGEAADEIASSFSNTKVSVTVTGNLDEAVRRATDNARPGDVVLFAPACASFDQYKNYEQRGEHFISLVNNIAEGLKNAG